MKTYLGYDHTLCGEEGCKKKETCLRYLTFKKMMQEAIQKGEGFMAPIYRPKEVPENCDLYFKAKEE